jgi:fumarylacetoacetate (FAA) hydrolase
VTATRRLRAGTILGAGTVSEGDPDRVGSACIAEKRGQEMISAGEARTSFLRFGDRVRIEMLDERGESIFGALDQRVVRQAP